MAEGSMSSGVPETDITTLTAALKAQQQLLQKLYADLDQEREASSTAADEALSMILRLQGEKSAVKMEASQYKRLAEEKICHAEEALAIFEDLIYQKEMEIASLEFQLQAYRYKLLSLGISTELGAGENIYPENMLLQNVGNAETSVSGAIRRINSLPPIELKDFLNKIDRERERERDRDKDKDKDRDRDRPIIPKPDVMKKVEKKVDQEVNLQSLDVEKKSGNHSGGNLNSIWTQIKQLDERVKEISDCKDSGGEKSLNLMGPSRTFSLPPIPRLNFSTSNVPTSEEIVAALDQVKHNEKVQDRETVVSTSGSTSVHDVFEVPQSYENRKAYEGEKKVSKLTLEFENRLGKLNSVSDETSDTYVKDETDMLKKMLHCKKHENKLFKPRDGISTVDSSPRERAAGITDSHQARFQQLWRRIERLEGERNSIKQEISHAGEEELKLFREIHEQLTLIRSEMRTPKEKKPPPQEDESLHTVMEAMLHFWL